MSTTAAAGKPHPLEFLIGTWAGKGRGFYPTIPTFEFFEELTFVKDPAGRPVVSYSQKTRRAIPDTAVEQGLPQQATLVPGPPLHAESGFIRLPGVASVEVGTIDGTTIDWTATGIVRSPSAKAPHVTQFTRNWVINPEQRTFSYRFSMATENTPLQHHLEAELHKVGSAM
ncbi:THAP domain-containing protein 4 [Mortierella sp. GBA30]|nr:THAP domain-containing protein 4 [Mortierella sp. GBA30]